ncbi:MAG: hypothetical protein INR66_22790 [Gordonia polyisoprenivorans]|nr:hypothetical protein [Gordonia polyisoprenivorans]
MVLKSADLRPMDSTLLRTGGASTLAAESCVRSTQVFNLRRYCTFRISRDMLYVRGVPSLVGRVSPVPRPGHPTPRRRAITESTVMRKISKAVAAAGLAAATIVSGLSFGSAAIAAPSNNPSAVDTGSWSGPFSIVVQRSSTKWVTPLGSTRYSEGGSIRKFPSTAVYNSLMAAANASEANFTYNEATKQLRYDGYCIEQLHRSSGDGIATVSETSCSSNPLNAQWEFDEAGGNLTLRNAWSKQYWGDRALNTNGGTQMSSSPLPIVDGGYDAGAISGVKVESTDVAGRSATLSGRATPGAKLLFNGGNQITVPESGMWVQKLTGLKLGKNPITVEQWVDGSQKGDPVTVDADLSIAQLDASVAWNTTDEYKDAVVSGTAEKGATVEAYNGSKKVGSGQASSSTGEYSFPIDAPNAAGDATVTVKQKLGDDYADDAKDLTVKYGAGVAVDSPVDESEHDGGKVTITGTGAPDARVIVREKGSPNIIGTSEVQVNGKFSMTTSVDLDSVEHILDITQTSKGNNVTKSMVTLNPGASNELSPVTLDGPATVTPGKENLFTGTATPGAKYTVINASGNQIVPGEHEVDENGKWSFKRVVSNGAAKFDFKLLQSKGNLTEPSELFSVKAASNQLAPVTVSTESMVPGKSNTFNGTGEPGATYRVLNISGTQIVPGTHKVNEAGNWSFDRVVSNGAAKFDFKIEQTKGGAPVTSQLFSVKAASVTPVTVDNKTVTPGVNNTFTGTATPGATYRVLNVSGTQIVPGIHTVGHDGKWSFDRVVSTGAKEFRFALEQTVNGTPTTSELFTITANSK